MTTSSAHPTCPICGELVSSGPIPSQHLTDVDSYECNRCGKFKYLRGQLESSQSFKYLNHLVSAWIQRQNKNGVSNPTVPPIKDVTWLENLKYAGFPQTVTEKLNALLQSYAEIVDDDIGKTIKPHQYPQLVSKIAAKNANDVIALNQLLHQMNFIDFSGGENLKIKAAGWSRIEELGRTQNVNDSAFIAMWYDDCTKEYRISTIKALLYCGYKPLIVDQTEYNGFIMDQVISLIRTARFIVADFSSLPEVQAENMVKRGVRGGVYWEAGFAFGMGKPVIHTCNDDEESKLRRHFDVEQYRTLFWRPDELGGEIRDLSSMIEKPNFTERLAQNILRTIGKGNYRG